MYCGQRTKLHAFTLWHVCDGMPELIHAAPVGNARWVCDHFKACVHWQWRGGASVCVTLSVFVRPLTDMDTDIIFSKCVCVCVCVCVHSTLTCFVRWAPPAGPPPSSCLTRLGRCRTWRGRSGVCVCVCVCVCIHMHTLLMSMAARGSSLPQGR